MTFKIADVKNDYNILLKAKEDAKEYLEEKELRDKEKIEKIISKINEG